MPSRLVSLVCLVLLACSPEQEPPPAARDESSAPVGGAGLDTAATHSPADDPRPRVVFLGTSLTAGLGLPSEEDTYVTRVAELADSAGVPIRAVNAGVSGETSAGGLRRLNWVLEESLDVLVVELGANDGLRGQDPDALEENLTTIVRRTRSRRPDARIVLAGMEAPPNMGERYTTAFRNVFRRVADREGVSLLPFLLEGVAGVPELNQADGIHPTAQGHQRMARTLWPYLEPVVRRAAAGPDGGGG